MPLDPLRVAVRVALVQGATALVVWLLLLLWSSRQVWLLETDQLRFLRMFVLWQIPALAILPLVVLPAVWAHRLADDAGLDVTYDTEFLKRVLAFPREVSLLEMAVTAVVFLFGVLRLRIRAGAPALEAAKLEVLGFVVAVLLGILSYFLLQSPIRPVLAALVRQGAMPPPKTSFPVWQKIFVCSLGVAFIVFGLFGQLALTWAERFSEAKTEQAARENLRGLVERARAALPRDAAQWSKLLVQAGVRPGSGAIAVLDSFGRKVATVPEHPAGADGAILGSEEVRESLARLGNGSTVLRRGVVRLATSIALGDGRRIVALSPPDPAGIRRLLVSVGVIAGEVLVLSVLLAAAVGRGLTRPLHDLEAQARAFGRDPQAFDGGEAVPTDDEIGSLSREFAAMRGEILRVQARLRETERRAATAELLAGVAHEVRNPLFGITSTLAALEGELGSDRRFDRHFELVKKEGARLSRMMEEMLALQRSPRAAAGPVEVEPLLRSCAEWARATFPERLSGIGVACAPGLVLPRADEEGLRSVLTNLVENASRSANRPVAVRLSGESAPAGVVIRVEDDGEGVDPGLAAKIFEPFVSGRAGGTGMGLALCRQIVRQHGGDISLAPRSGGGTTFSLSLPDLGAGE